MSLDFQIRRHPARQELFAYAEAMADKRPIPSALGMHVTACPQCAAEVRAIRGSLQFVGSARELEPSDELAANILIEASRLRTAQDRARRRHGIVVSAVRGLAYAAALVVVSVGTFAAVLGNPATEQTVAASPEPAPVAELAPVAAAPAADSLEKTAEQVRALSAAMNNTGGPQTFREREHLRTVSATDADLDAALDALQRNPGNPRAHQVVQSSLKKQAENLRDLYVERSL